MSEDLINELIEKIKEKAYVPNHCGSNAKEVHLRDVIEILNEYKLKKSYWW